MLDFDLMMEVLPKLWQGVGMSGRLSMLILLLAFVGLYLLQLMPIFFFSGVPLL